MATFKDFYHLVLPYMTNPPLPAVEDELRNAAIEFCERTDVINAIGDPLAVVAGEPTLDIEVSDTNLIVHRALNVWSSVGKLTPKSKKELDELYPEGWMTKEADEIGRIPYWLQLARGAVRLVPSPTFSSTDEIRIEASFKPTRSAGSLPDYLLEHYAQAIAYGCMGRLHQHEKAGYANPQRAGEYLRAFESEITGANDEVVRGQNKPLLRTGRDEFV